MPTPGAHAGPESSSRLQLLEFSAFLENNLWPNFDPDKSSAEHIMSTASTVENPVVSTCSLKQTYGIEYGIEGSGVGCWY